MPSRLNYYATAFGEPGAAVADDVHLGTKHNSASGSSLCLLEKMENKTNCSQYILGLNLFFFVTGVRVNFSKINFDRARLTTVNSLLTALRGICNISSNDGEDFFAGELLVY